MPTQEEIAASIAKSQAKYRARKEQQEIKNKQLKAKKKEQNRQVRLGLEWLKENPDVRIHTWSRSILQDHIFTIGYKIDSVTKNKTYFQVAYAIKSIKDKENEKIGNGIVGYRLSFECSSTPYWFEDCILTEQATQFNIEEMIDNRINTELLRGEIQSPSWLRKGL